MKKFKCFKITTLALFALSFLSCNLELQEGFTFTPDVDDEDPFTDITAWQFLQQNRQLTEEGGLSGELYNYMVAAIEAAGMEDDYNESSSGRTFLFLNNTAFTNGGGNNVIEIITGSSEIVEGETPEEVMARADLDVLRLVLKYHIITSYVDQLTLAERNVNYEFQTLIPGEDGRIILRRDERYNIDINTAPAPVPSSATSQNERIRNYNYVLSNGIGHTIADPVRNAPYPAPNPDM